MADTTENITCFTCSLVGKYGDLAAGYVGSLADILQTGMVAIFVSTAPVWLVVSLILMLLRRKKWEDLAFDSLFIFIAFFLFLFNGNDIVIGIYAMSLEVMGSTANLTFLGEGGSGVGRYAEGTYANQEIVNLVYTVEKSVRNVFDVALAMITGTVKKTVLGSSFEIPDVAGWFLGIALIVPYFLVLTVFFSKVIIAVFRVMMISLFSPIIMYCFAFGWGRGMGGKAVKTLFASIMILLSCTAAMSMLVYGASQLETSSIAGENVVDVWENYLLLVALGWMGSAFMVEANGIANSLTDSVLSNAGTAVITAGAAGTAAKAAELGMRGLTAKNSAGNNMIMSGMKTAGGAAFTAAKAVANPKAALVSMADKLTKLRSQS